MQFEKMCRTLIIKEPFWGLFMLGFNKRMTKAIPTLAVAKSGMNYELLVNPDFWDAHDDTAQMAFLLHELHHIAFDHLTMSSDFEDRFRFNIATDAEVNCYIDGLPKDDGYVDAEAMGLPTRKGSKWYYDNLPTNKMFAAGGKGVSTVDDHSTWKQFFGMSDTERELMKNQVDGMLKQAAEETMRQRGTIPGEMQGYIDELLKEKPRIYDWRVQFRRMMGTSIDTSFRKTYQRASKRFPGSPGIKLKRRVNILVAVDTSGSVSDQELADFFSEISHIHKAGARIHIIECDAAITNEWDFEGLRHINISGRGGTDFKPVIDYYRNHRKDYNTLVFFTDGEAPLDELDVPNNNMTWVITSSGERQDYPGKTIYIPKQQEKND